VVRFVPELAPLAAHAIEVDDAERDLGRRLALAERRLMRTTIKIEKLKEKRGAKPDGHWPRRAGEGGAA